MALLNITLDIVQNEFKKDEPQWFQSHWDDLDRKYLYEECNKENEFDPTNVRKSLLKNINDSTVLECAYGKIHVI